MNVLLANEAMGPLLIPVAFVGVVVLCVVAVIFSAALFGFVTLIVVRVLSSNERIERAKQRASEVVSEDDEW